MIDRPENRSSLWCFDVGNTSVLIGEIEDRLHQVRRLSPEKLNQLENFLDGFVSASPPETALVSSVNRETEERLVSILEKWSGNMEINRFRRDFQPIIKLDVPEPDQVGDDRILNATAAWELYGGPAVVVDFGTAVTFDVVSERGTFLGGSIAPGISSSARALFRDCDQLPLIHPEPVKQSFGNNTRSAMQSGIYNGFVGMVQHILDRIKNSLGGKTKVIGMGGDVRLLQNQDALFDDVNENLTLYGIVQTWDKS